jgi:hypothetical protein
MSASPHRIASFPWHPERRPAVEPTLDRQLSIGIFF